MTTAPFEELELMRVVVPIDVLGISVIDQHEAGCTVGIEWDAVPEIAAEVFALTSPSLRTPDKFKRLIRAAHRQYMENSTKNNADTVAYAALAYLWNHPDMDERGRIKAAVMELMLHLRCAHVIVALHEEGIVYAICAPRSTDNEVKH